MAEDGTRRYPGGRQAWCPSSPVFRTAALATRRRAVAGRYGDHPAVALWHVVERARMPQRPVLLRRERGRLPPLARGQVRRRSTRSTTRGAPPSGARPTASGTRSFRRAQRSRPATPVSCSTSTASARTSCSTTTAPRPTPSVPLSDTSRSPPTSWSPRTSRTSTTGRGRPIWTSSRTTTTSTTASPHPNAELAFAADLSRGLARVRRGSSWSTPRAP